MSIGRGFALGEWGVRQGDSSTPLRFCWNDNWVSGRRAVREPPLRGEGGDGALRARGVVGRGRRAVREPPLRGEGGRGALRARAIVGRGRRAPTRDAPTRGREKGSGKGDGSPHARGQRMVEGDGRFANRPYGGRGDWIPVSTGMTGRVRDGCPRGTPLRGRERGREVGKGDGSPHARGQRIVEGDGRFANRPYEGQREGKWERGWVPACARTTNGRGGRAVREPPLRGAEGREVGKGDGSPHARGQRMVEGDGRFANRPYGGRGDWIPVSTGMTGRVRDGCPRGTPLRGAEGREVGKGMGPRMREDNEW